MGLLFIWIFFAAIVGAIASDKTGGFWGGFLWSLLLSPVIGLIIALVSKTKQRAELEQKAFNNLASMPRTKEANLSDDLEQLQKLKEKGLLSEQEYQTMRSNAMKKFNGE